MVNHQPLCIRLQELEAPFELKSGLIHLLPKFHGLTGECPHAHLRKLKVVCSTSKPTGITEEQVLLRTFPFSLEDAASNWLYSLASNFITSWLELLGAFLEHYFPAAKMSNIRKDIASIQQTEGESFYEYWERFKRLVDSCPHHRIDDQ